MSKVNYVDGYVLIVPKDKEDEYRKMADEAAESWLKNGALAVRECVGDDLTPDMGEHQLLQFPQLMKAGENETVWYSYIEFASKEDRDRINKLVSAEMEAYAKEHPDHMDNMPFDMNKMAFGGFYAKVSKTSA